MSLLAARALSLTIGQPLFFDLSFTVNQGDRSVSATPTTSCHF